MCLACLRHLAVFLVSLGILLPGLGAAAATLVPGAVTLVICDGEGLRRITLNAAGVPVGDVALSEDQAACALLSASLPPGPRSVTPPMTIVPAAPLAGPSLSHRPKPAIAGGGPRAPPRFGAL